jgi:hypothetical protein
MNLNFALACQEECERRALFFDAGPFVSRGLLAGALVRTSCRLGHIGQGVDVSRFPNHRPGMAPLMFSLKK